MSLRPFTPIDPEDPRGALRVVRVNLANVDTAGGMAAILNPFGERAIVLEAVADITTPATAACTLDVGVAANATTAADTLIDGKDVNAAAVVAHSMLEYVGNYAAATGNAAGVVAIGATQYVTASAKTGASAGLVGTLQVVFMKLATVT